MNIFLEDYYDRLRHWHELREKLTGKDVKTICIEVDKFWQAAPLLTRYLHSDDIENWPGPWTLLNDNSYCLYARALGIVYTLVLLGVQSIDLVEGTDDNIEDVVLVIVKQDADTKYVLNWNPGSVTNINLDLFTIKKHLSLEPIVKKLENTQ